MKISELINNLQSIKDKIGDKAIFAYNYEVPSIAYLKEKEVILIM